MDEAMLSRGTAALGCAGARSALPQPANLGIGTAGGGCATGRRWR